MSSTPCTHLESLIREPSSTSVRAIPIADVNRIPKSLLQEYYDSGAGYVIPEGIKNRSYENQFRRKLEKAGLEPLRVDILTLRFVYSMSFRDIAEELGVVSITTAVRLHNESLTNLRKKGFK